MMNKIMGIVMLLVYVCVASALLSDAFTTPYNMQNIVRYTAFYGIIGIGVSLVIISGGIDLSIGSVVGLVGCLLPIALTDWGWSIPASLLFVMLVSLLLGLTHGLLITKLRLQPFIVTLCGLMIYRGLARWITNDTTQGFGSSFDDSLRLLATGKPCSVPLLILTAGFCVAAHSVWSLLSNIRREGNWSTLRLGILSVIGVYLGISCSSRYWSGVTFEFGEPMFELWGIEVSTFSATVPRAAEMLPAQYMRYSGYAILPSLAWILVVVLSSNATEFLRTLGRLLYKLAIVAGAVIGAALLYSKPIRRLLRLINLRIGIAWVDIDVDHLIPMIKVFGGLAVGMLLIGWFAKESSRISASRVHAPWTAFSATTVMYLVSRTPITETLVPAPFLVLMMIAVFAGIFLNQTVQGRYLLALGRNEEAARYSGIRTDRIKILAYVLCGIASGIGGILFALDGNSIQPSGHGNFLELYAIAAAVLGGCSLRGGEGSILGVIIGAAVMRVLYNSINILGIPSQLEFTIIGSVILFGVLADELVKRFATRKANLAATEP